MKFLVNILLLLGGLNLILARSIYWEPYPTHFENPWADYNYNGGLFAWPSGQNSDEEKDTVKLFNSFGKGWEPRTSDEFIRDDVETLRAAQVKEIESLIKAVLDENTNEDETEVGNKSQEDTKEIEDDKENEADGDDDKKDNDDDDDDKKDDDDDKKDDDDDDKKDDDDDKKDDDDDKKDDDGDNTAEHDDDDTDSSPEKKPSNEPESKESKDSLNSKNSDEIGALPEIKFSEENLEKHQSEVSEKDIKELTALLMTISTLEDLMKISVNSAENEESLDTELQNEKKLKEVNDYLSLFGSLLDKVLDESAENENDKNDSTERVNEDNSKENDNDSKDDHDEDASVAFKFHGIDSLNTNLNNHRYDIVPTSSPYLPETYSANADNNNVVQEYVEARETIDTLQDSLLSNKLTLDKDFYNIIANENYGWNMKSFAKDISNFRENVYKMKQTVDDMQDIKSKLYFHQLIKTALKEARSH